MSAINSKLEVKDVEEIYARSSAYPVEPPSTIKEDEDAVWTMKSNKTPEVDNIPAELIKSGGEEFI